MANEKQLIDANDVYSLFEENGTARLHVGHIDVIPRVDAVEVVHGWWKPRPHRKVNSEGRAITYCDFHYCSECGTERPMVPPYNYCPNCGAKMDGDGNV